MCGVMLAMIIFVLELFKFPVIQNSFTRFPSYTNFIFATVSYRSSSSSYCCSWAVACPCRYSLASSCSYLTAAGFSSSAPFSTMSFSISCAYPIFSIILLYNKEAISRTPYSLSASASRIAATGADTALYNFEIVFLKNKLIVLLIHLWEIFWKFYGQKKRHHAQATPRRSFYRCKKPMKTWLNLRWKTMMRLLKLYLKLGHLSMYKKRKYTKKRWFFFLKKR